MKKLSVALGNITVCCMLLFHGASYAEVLGTAIAAGGKVTAAVLTGETVKSLVESARREATQLVAEAESSGNVLVTRAADELNLASDNVMRMFSAEMDETFEKFDEDKRDILIGLASATKVASNLGDTAYTIKDTLSLDMRSILGSIPFVKEQLVLQSISGLSVIDGKSNYKIKVTGSYIGLPGEDHSTRLSLWLDGKEIEGVEVDSKQIHLAELRIPSNEFIQSLSEDSPTRIPMTMHINQEFKKRFLGFLWSYKKKSNYTADITLTVYPKYAGNINVISRNKVMGWKKILPMERDMTHSDHCSHHCGDHHGTSHSVEITTNGVSPHPKLGDKRITSASCNFIAGISGYSVDEGTRVSQDGSRAVCQIRFRTQPQTFRLTAHMEEYGVLEEVDKSYAAKLYFDQLTEVRLPKNSGVVFIKGDLVTGDNVDMLASQITVDSPIQVVRRLDNAEDKSLFLTAVRPQDL